LFHKRTAENSAESETPEMRAIMLGIWEIFAMGPVAKSLVRRVRYRGVV